MLYICCSAFALGIGIATYARVPASMQLLSALVAIALWSHARFIVPPGLAIRRNLFISAAALAMLPAGMMRVSLVPELPRELDLLVGGNVSLGGVVISEPDPRDSYTRLTIDVDALRTAEGELPVRAKVIARVPRYPEFGYGDRVIADGTLAVPAAFQTETGRTFDYPSFLRKDGIGYELSYAEAKLVGHGAGNAFRARLYALKGSLVEKIGETFPEPQSSLLSGVLLGGKNALGKDVSDEFARAGLSHVVVLSGYNITIVSDAIARTFAFLPYFAGIAAGGAGVVLFVLMTGATASAVRAGAMALLAVAARFGSRRYDQLRALVIAGVLMVLHNPLILAHDPSFQLSFLAAFGLIAVTPVVEKRLPFVPSKWGMREVLSTTLATQAFVLPLILYMTGNLSLVALPANVIVLPTMPTLMLSGFLAAVAAYVAHPLALVASIPAYLLLSFVLATVHAAAKLPFAAVPVQAFSAAVLAAWYGAYAFLLVRLRRNEPRPDAAGISPEAMEYEFVS